MTGYAQEAPFAMQVEPVEGCNLRCAFCGIAGIRAAGTRDALSGPFRYMDLGVAAVAAAQAAAAGWNPRVEFAMHGEPTLHPDLPALAGLFRAALPRAPLMLTTNGIPMLGRWRAALDDLYCAGVDTIAVDDYRPYRCRDAVLGTALPGVAVLRYPAGGQAASPHRRPKPGERRLILVHDISQATEGNHSHLSNHAGSAAPPDQSANGQRCAVPFREISVRWDGNVAICCNDWRGQFKIGNIRDTPLAGLWQHPAFQAARKRLLAAGRDFAPCQGCTHRTYRNGLLPDKNGRVTLAPPGPADQAAIDAALAGPPYTAPVARKWELPVVAVT